jgi:hypothetical protein
LTFTFVPAATFPSVVNGIKPELVAVEPDCKPTVTLSKADQFPGEAIWTIETVACAAVTAPIAAIDRPNRADFITNGFSLQPLSCYGFTVANIPPIDNG